MEIRLEKEAALVETVLFLESEALDEGALARITGLSRDVVERALEVLVEDSASAARGLEPLRSGGGWILAPKTDLWESLKERYGKKAESRLSRAAIETLSIVAYSQPITRAEVEAIRGVSADGMIRFLLDKEFIREVGKKEAPGRPVQYGTTKEFLKYFRLGSIADLPKLDELERERFGISEPREAASPEPGEPKEQVASPEPAATEEGLAGAVPAAPEPEPPKAVQEAVTGSEPAIPPSGEGPADA